MQGCCEDGLRQRRKIVNLIKSVNYCLPVFEFTVFSNISIDEVDGTFLNDETLLLSEDLKYVEHNLTFCETYASFISKSVDILTPDVKRCILELWCINKDNKWDLRDCSLSKCIKDVDEKLKKSLVTRRSVDEAMKEEGCKNKKTKQKKYIENPNIVAAPDIFKTYLNTRCLTKDQNDLFNNEERFLWVEGPAGSGKTIVMLGKIIDIALKTPPNKRILIILPGWSTSPVPKHHLKLLNKIRENISCVEIVYDYTTFEGDISEKLEKARSSLSQQLSDSRTKIVLLRLETCLVHSTQNVITRCFDYIFVDDYQVLFDRLFTGIFKDPGILKELANSHENITSQVLLPVVQNSSTNITSMWILNDDAQSWSKKVSNLPIYLPDLNQFALNRFLSFTTTAEELRNNFVNSKELTANLRNTFEISAMLSIVRTHHKSIDLDYIDTLPAKWPQQEGGHFLRGKKPIIHLGQTSETSTWREVLVQELEMLRGSDSCLRNKDIAVILIRGYGDPLSTAETVSTVVEGWNTSDDKITALNATGCMSAEWAAVIIICQYRPLFGGRVKHPDNNREKITSYFIPQLYSSLARARVYCSVILLDYIANICRQDDKLFEELRLRSDVCKIIDR